MTKGTATATSGLLFGTLTLEVFLCHAQEW